MLAGAVTDTDKLARLIGIFGDLMRETAADKLIQALSEAEKLTVMTGKSSSAVQKGISQFQDAVLGSLGGVFYGTVMEFRNGQEFLVADAHWLPPESDPIGPMVLEVTCKVSGPATALTVRQSSSENGERWSR